MAISNDNFSVAHGGTDDTTAVSALTMPLYGIDDVVYYNPDYPQSSGDNFDIPYKPYRIKELRYVLIDDGGDDKFQAKAAGTPATSVTAILRPFHYKLVSDSGAEIKALVHESDLIALADLKTAAPIDNWTDPA